MALAVVAGAGTRIALGSLLTPTVGAVGAMVATLVGEAISTVTAAAFLGRHTVRLQGPRLGLRPRDTWVAFVAQLGLWALAASAVLLGRRVLPSATAGDFAATATLASAAFFLPMAVAVAYFPRFATRPDQAVLRRALRLAALLGGGTAAVLAVAPATSVRALGGPSFRTDHLVAVLLASGAAALGCAGVATYFLLAARRLCALAVWGGIGLCLGGLLTSSPRALAGVVAAGTIGTATTVVGAALRVRRDTLSPRSLPLPAPVAVPSPVPVPVHLVPAPTCAVSVVVPSFNGGGALRPTVLGILRTLDGIPGGSEVIVVIDGSTDGSEQTLRDLDDRVVVERLPENRGKGAAVRHGAERARGTLVGFLDGDGDIEPEVLGRLVAVLGEPGTWAAIGSKRVEGADVRTSVGRRVLSAAYRLLVLTLFDFAVSDTQCGAKLFRREALLATLPWACEEGFALDVELLALGRRFDLGAIVEVPVRLARPEAAPSSVSARAVVRTLRDTFRIWSRLQDAPATVCDTGWGAEAALAAMAQRAPRRKELACAS
ncbi:MAG: glycosyltransferase [Acidimicrobiia bacterium]|nr:glycosyltransferase [Acidimicrobiia bacterium]